MRIAALIILYNPNEEVKANIASYYEYVEKIYVFDNTENNESTIDFEDFDKSRIVYFFDGQNKGIAERLNIGAKMAQDDGYDWLLTMDQDSKFTSTAITNYFKNIGSFSGIENVAMFGINYFPDDNNPNNSDFTDNDYLITSGSLLNLNLFNKIGLFDELLFIDSVDEDYCIRARILGYRIIKFSNIHLAHEVGNVVFRSSIKTFFLIKKIKGVHPPLRSYYIVRNNLYLRKKYRHLNKSVMNSLNEGVQVRMRNWIYYGRNLRKYCFYIYKAWVDFRGNKMGK